ncbi:MAG: Calx-beta domain-containing protein, partial [Methylococcaceae bacterium]
SADGGRTYTAVYTPVANSRQTASISVNANTYTDAVGNSGLASNALNLTLDTQLPSLSITGTTVTEGNDGIRNATLTVSLSSPTSQPVTVNYATQDGTAQAGSDYLATSNILTIPVGQTTATIQISIYGDTQLEPDETFRVNLSSPPNAQLGNSSTTVTIKNDDVAQVNNTLTYLGTETIDLDYGSRSGMISGMTFSTGSNESAWIYGDGYGGYGKTARLSIASIEGFSGVDNLIFSTEPKLLNTNEYAIDTADNSNYYLLHILDPMSRTHGDTSNGVTYEAWKWASASANTTLPSVSISGTMLSEGSGGTSNAASLTLSLSAPSSQTVSVDYSTQNGSAVAVSDYSYTLQTATFAPGQTSQTIQIPIVGDTTVEQDESFRVNLSNPVNVNLGNERSAQVTIINDDVVLPTISISGTTITEGNDGTRNAELTVNLSAASSQTITVNYTTQDGSAIAGSDYQLTRGTLRFEPGDTRETIEVPVIGDTTVESDESFQMLLSAATHALLNPNATSGTVQISNDDTATAPVTSYSAGQPVIDLGSQYGKLIKPVQVDGGHWFYYWDVSGDGTSDNRDRVDHDWLDGIFQQDVNGWVNSSSDTDNTYRYATINGVKLALPTVGDTLGNWGYRNGTAVSGNTSNENYNDYLAIWDASNGTATGIEIYGMPPSWPYYYFWSATSGGAGHHSNVYLPNGLVDNVSTNDYNGGYYYPYYVALEVF